MSLLPYREISCAEVQTKLERGRPVRLVDVRQPWEYARRRIPGALLLPTDEFTARFSSELDPAEEIVCVCEHGIRSEAAARFLAAEGYPNVATMTGGMAEYHGPVEAETGKPMKMLTKEEAAAEIADFDYQVDEGVRAIFRIMAANEDDPDEPLKLLEVNADTPAAGIMPLHFPPDAANGILFAYELVVVTPDEFEKIRSADLHLPDDWRIGPVIHHPNGLLKTAA